MYFVLSYCIPFNLLDAFMFKHPFVKSLFTLCTGILILVNSLVHYIIVQFTDKVVSLLPKKYANLG